MYIFTDDPKIFAKETNIIVEDKSPEKIIIRNTETGARMALSDKTDIKIISPLISSDEIIVELLAIDLKIDKSRIITLLKKLAKRNFLKDITEERRLP